MLRSQIDLLQAGQISKKRSAPSIPHWFRLLWIVLSQSIKDWKSHLVIVKPATVIRWHRNGFKKHWKKKSRGRPKTKDEIIALIRKIHQENPLFSPEKIHEQLLLLNVIDAPAHNTIAKYLKTSNFKLKTPTEHILKNRQAWKTFLHNHRLWSMDFFVVPTATFQLLYVFIIINHATRKIEHVNVTAHPNSEWLKQQMREAMPFDHKPRYLLHDNDPMFTSTEFQKCLSNMNVESVRTSYRSPWQNAICERAVGIFKRDLIDVY